jgi:hypothetical protein
MMTQTIADVPVEFAGQFFRNALVARWASFFDRIGQRWEQAVISFGRDDTAGVFRPDFFLPDVGPDGTFVEVIDGPPIPDWVNAPENVVISRVSECIGSATAVIYGDPLAVFTMPDGIIVAGYEPPDWSVMFIRGRPAAAWMAALAARQMRFEPVSDVC